MSAAYSKEEGAAINMIALRSAGLLLLAQLVAGIGLVVVAVVVLIAIYGQPMDEDMPAIEQKLLLAAIPVQILFNFVTGLFLLYPILRRGRKKGRFETSFPATQRPYLWSWTGIVSGIQLIGAVALGFLLGDSNHSGFTAGLAIASLYAANYFVITRLLRDGQARLVLPPKP